MSEAAKNRRSFSMAYLLAQCAQPLKLPDKQPTAYNAGLYETGTDNLIYSWEQLLGDEILEGGVVHVTDGVLTTNNANLTNTSSDILTGDLVIPKGVTVLGDNCFYKCVNLTAITIPEGVTLIESDAFYNCKSLAKINIPSSVNNIGGENGYTFYGCTALKEVYITDLVALLGIDVDSTSSSPFCYNATLYLNGTPIKDLIIPNGITEIKDLAFYGADITSVYIPDSVTRIGDRSFGQCNNLENITGGVNVSSVNCYAFMANPLIYEDEQKLRIIHNWLVSSSPDAVEIDIPEGVTVISDTAITPWCTQLKSVIIPDSVRSIGAHAFRDIEIENVTFKGTMEQWHSIKLGEKWNINFLATNVICSDGTVALSPSIE